MQGAHFYKVSTSLAYLGDEFADEESDPISFSDVESNNHIDIMSLHGILWYEK